MSYRVPLTALITTAALLAAARAAEVAPAGISDLALTEVYRRPIGPRGLEPTEKLLKLDGKPVRVVGYMVHEDEPTPGLFMLVGHPVSLSEQEDGPADDLPGATLFVHMPKEDSGLVLPYRSGPWSVNGTLEVGNKEEANGRVSFVRLYLFRDPSSGPAAAPSKEGSSRPER